MSTGKGVSKESIMRLPPASHLEHLEPVAVLDKRDERAETLLRLVGKGHSAVALLRDPKLILHSHLPHLLGSAYFLGATTPQLEELYEHEVASLLSVDDSFVKGDAIDRGNWREFLAQKIYTVAYVQFFDDEVKRNDNDWEKVLGEYLFQGPAPLINGFAGGLGHPFIHLAYAWELQSPAVATEALSLGCTEYIPLHGLLDQFPPDTSTYKTTSLADVIKHVHDDQRFDNLFEYQGITNIGIILQKAYGPLLEHWNAWEVTDPTQQLEQCCDLSVLLGLGTGYGNGKFDFFLVHTMTVAHSLRVLWHFFPEDQRVCILRQYALYVILLYIAQLKPNFDVDIVDSIQSVPVDGRTWESVVEETLRHRWFRDAHFFKVVRAPKVFDETYGRKDGFYLRAAAKFVDEFNGWEGFGLGVEGFVASRDGYIPE